MHSLGVLTSEILLLVGGLWNVVTPRKRPKWDFRLTFALYLLGWALVIAYWIRR